LGPQIIALEVEMQLGSCPFTVTYLGIDTSTVVLVSRYLGSHLCDIDVANAIVVTVTFSVQYILSSA
jgi:hypothetical protein